MASTKRRPKVYHCDMFYYDGVCALRGDTDAADIRYFRGRMMPPRSLCNNFGVTDDGKICDCCVEHKRLFRKPPMFVPIVGTVTPFQAKNIKAETIKAYAKRQPLLDFLKHHPSLYGVNVHSGKIIRVKTAT